MGVSFFLSSYIVSTIGEEANGFTQLANNFVTYASLLTVAFNSMAGRFMAVSYHCGQRKKVKEYYSTILVCNTVLLLVLVPMAILVVTKLERLLVIENANVQDVKALFACVFINFFINLFASVFGIAMFVTNKLYIQNALLLGRYLLNAVLLFCAFSIFPAKIYYVSFVAVFLTVALLLLNVYFEKKLIPGLCFHWRNFRMAAAKEMLLSGIWNTVNQCGNLLMTGVDLLLANLFVSPTMMGVLSVAKIVPNAIFTLATTLNNNFAPELVINYSHGDREKLLRQLRSNMKISSVLLSIPIITFSSFGVPFYRLWMPNMDAEMLTLLSFLTCMAFIPWAGPQTLYNVFTAADKLKVNSVAFMATGLLNVLVTYVLLKTTSLGIYAVAGVSSILTILRNLIITAPYTAKLLGLKWYTFYKDVLVSMLCCAVNLIIAVPFLFALSLNTWLGLAAAVCLTCAGTLAVDCFVILNKTERTAVLSKITRKRNNG